jgi:translation initiation factor 2 beta subunit (eIF-2beta)/eIF-5
MTMARIEVCRLGQKAAQKIHRARYEERIRHYDLNPKVCERCGTAISYKRRENKYCSSSCAAKHNNEKFPKRKRGTPENWPSCLVCSKRVSSYSSKYCGPDCRLSYKENRPFEILSKKDKRLKVFVEQNQTCVGCKNSEWRGQTIDLELDHIDGNRQNNSRENLRGLCPNCHSQTENYKGRNIKNIFNDEQIVEVLRKHTSVYQALTELGMSPQRNVYLRVRRLIEKYGLTNIEVRSKFR